MVGIFAIIAIIGQAIFAIIAMDFVAIIANYNDMNDLGMKNKVWLATHLAQVAHGGRGKVAAAVGVTPTQLTRMACIDPAAPPKNTQNIPLDKLLAMAGYFRDLPPGIVEILTSSNTKLVNESAGAIEAEVAERAGRLPLHLQQSFLTILREWTPDEAIKETAAETHRPKSPKGK